MAQRRRAHGQLLLSCHSHSRASRAARAGLRGQPYVLRPGRGQFVGAVLTHPWRGQSALAPSGLLLWKDFLAV